MRNESESERGCWSGIAKVTQGEVRLYKQGLPFPK